MVATFRTEPNWKARTYTSMCPPLIKRLCKRCGMSPAVLFLALILLLLVVPPTIYLLMASLYTTELDGSFKHFSLQYYENLFTHPRFFSNLATTSVYSLGSAIVAITFGVLQAWIVERTNTPGRHFVYIYSIVSLAFPHVLYTVAWLLILGRTGPVNDLLSIVFGSDGPLFNVYSIWGMIIIEGIGFAPLAFLLLSSVFRAADASFEEASMMSGAGTFTTFRRITLKLAMPGILALGLLVLIQAFESFEVPALVGSGGGVNVITTEIYHSIVAEQPPNYGLSAAYSVLLLVFVGAMLVMYSRLSRHAERFHTVTGKGFRPRLINLGRWRYFTFGLLVLSFLLIIGLPVLIVAYASILPYYSNVSLEALRGFTFEHYTDIIAPGSMRDSLVNTFILGGATASIVVPITAVCAWLVARQHRGSWLLDQLATLPLVFPAIVMGVAFLNVFLASPIPIYATLFSLIYASAVRYLPYGMRYAHVGVLSVHKELEEVSGMSGAVPLKTFLRVSVPLIAPALVAAWLFVFLLSVRAVSMPILLAGPESQVMALAIFDMWENGSIPELAAMGIGWTLLMSVLACIFYVIGRRFGLAR